MATYVLLVVLVLVTLLLGAVIVHYRRKNLNNEKALHTRSATLSHETHLKIMGCKIFCCKYGCKGNYTNNPCKIII